MNTFVTAFHEAVFLYALALNETIAEGFSSTNGSVITRKMWNRTFTGIAYKILNTIYWSIKAEQVLVHKTI